MLAILLAHALGAAIAPALVVRWGRRAFYPLAAVPMFCAVWAVADWPASHTADHKLVIDWVPGLSMDIALRWDSLAAIMSLLALGIGALVVFYCGEYFHHSDGHTENRLPSFAAELVGFSGAMFGLIVADNMLVLYVFWELTTVLSFLLIGHYAERFTSRRAATQALLVTTAGGLAMLTGIIVLGQAAGSYLLSDVVATPPTGTAVSIGVVLILSGALSKSAIVPLHFWLPGAMAAPTPVSAYLHAAAMVKAGVYLIARLAPGFADSPGWRPTAVILGLLTMLTAGWRALREYDLKLLLAYGTVSYLGLITVLLGAGGRDLVLAGLTVLCAHAMFKAALFMVVGIIDHATGTRDIRRLAGLGRRCPALMTIAVAATASMAALPPFLG
ncbi:proton-conducting transporter membrane subunit, partial [Mycobacterium gordonae]